jgi:hypothetical protein
MNGRHIRFLHLHRLGRFPYYRCEDKVSLVVYGVNRRNTQKRYIFTISRQNVGGSHTAVQDISVGFRVADRQRINVVCTEAPGVVVYTNPAMDDEGDMESVLDGNYGATSLDHNQHEHYNDTSPSFWENVVQGRYPEV